MSFKYDEVRLQKYKLALKAVISREAMDDLPEPKLDCYIDRYLQGMVLQLKYEIWGGKS